MRVVFLGLCATVALASGCKQRSGAAQVRDNNDTSSSAADDLNVQLSKLAAALNDDFSSLYADSGAAVPAIALADDRDFTPDELDKMKAEAIEVNNRYKNALAQADQKAAARLAKLKQLQSNLAAANAALEKIDPADIGRYTQGLADVKTALDRMMAANNPTPPAEAICATTDGAYVFFQIRAAADAKVGCFWSKEKTAFTDAATFSASTGRWTCPKWSKGNPQYPITVKVNGTDNLTDEAKALAKTCN